MRNTVKNLKRSALGISMGMALGLRLGLTISLTLGLGAFVLAASAAAQGDPTPGVKTSEKELGYVVGTAGLGTYADAAGTFILKRLLDADNFGGAELDVAELTFPVGYKGRGHLHAPIEIFYVLEGRMRHVVNGIAVDLDPGMIGLVRPGDTVEHIVLSEVPLKTLVIWLPGGFAQRLAGNLKQLKAPKD